MRTSKANQKKAIQDYVTFSDRCAIYVAESIDMSLLNLLQLSDAEFASAISLMLHNCDGSEQKKKIWGEIMLWAMNERKSNENKTRP